MKADPEFRFHTQEILRFGDQDSQGHINNAVYSTLFECNRVAFQTTASHLKLESDQVVVVAAVAIDFLRKRKKEKPSSIQDVENSVHISHDGISIDTIGMKAIVDNLNENQRILVEYIYFKGYTPKETSETLNIPLRMVKTRNRNCIFQLRENMTLEFEWM